MDIKTEDNDIVIRFSKDLLTTKSLNSLIEQIKMNEIAKKSNMIEQQAWDLSEEIKEEWWKKHGKKLLDRAGIIDI